MKTLINLIVFIILLTALLMLTSACSSTNWIPIDSQQTTSVMCVKMVPIRLTTTDKQNTVCTKVKASIIHDISGNKFILSLPDTTIQLHGLYRYSADREYYEAYDKDMHKYTLYYYSYRNRIYIQITPLHNGQVPYIDKSEVIYIVTTDNICS